MIALATVCAVSVLFRTVGQPFDVFQSAASRFRESGFGRSDTRNSLTTTTFDSTISECLQQIILTGKDQVKAGVPLLNVPPLDPVTIGPVFISDNMDFTFHLLNVTFAGLIDGISSKTMRVEYNTADKRIYLIMKVDAIELTTLYDCEIGIARLLPAFFKPGYALTSYGLLNATIRNADLKAFVEFKETPLWGQRLVLDSTYISFDFGASDWTFISYKDDRDVLIKYIRLIADNEDALDPVIEVLRPIIVDHLNKFLYKTMNKVFQNVILI